MSDPAAPWWAEVQHLRPRENRAEVDAAPSAPRTPKRRFERSAQQPEPALATLEHAVADGWSDDVDRAWAEAQSARRAPWDEAETPAEIAFWEDDEPGA